VSVPATGMRLGWADFVRGAAMICVVYFHTTLFLSAVGVDQTIGKAKSVFELFPLPAFFLMAGIFGARGILTWDFRTLAVRRLLPLAYVYVLWSVLRFVLFSAFPALPARDTDIPPADPISLALLPILPASIYWFLYALMLFMLVTWAARRVPRWVLVTVSLVISTLFTMGLVNTHTIAWNRIGALAFFFVVGVFFAKELTSAVERANVWHLVAVFSGFVVVGGSLVAFRSLLRVPLLVTLGQCLAVAVVVLIAKYAARVPALAFVRSIGLASLPIYLVHIFAIAPLAFVVGLLSPDWPAAVNIAVAASVSAIAIACGFGIARLARVAPWLLMPVFRTREPRDAAPAAPRPGTADTAPERR
jgi:uncharacterized membrane protein YcfT